MVNCRDVQHIRGLGKMKYNHTCIVCGHTRDDHSGAIEQTCIATFKTSIKKGWKFKPHPNAVGYCFCDDYKEDRFAELVKEALNI